MHNFLLELYNSTFTLRRPFTNTGTQVQNFSPGCVKALSDVIISVIIV